MGCKEDSKAYCVYDIEAEQVMIYRDVTFDELTIRIFPSFPQAVVGDTALDFGDLDIND